MKSTTFTLALIAATGSASQVFPEHHYGSELHNLEDEHWSEYRHEHHSMDNEIEDNTFPAGTGGQPQFQTAPYYVPSFQQPYQSQQQPTPRTYSQTHSTFRPGHDPVHPAYHAPSETEFYLAQQPQEFPASKLPTGPSPPKSVLDMPISAPSPPSPPTPAISGGPVSTIEQQLQKLKPEPQQQPQPQQQQPEFPVPQVPSRPIPEPMHHEAPQPVFGGSGPNTCWLKTRYRDMGQMVSTCSPGLELADDLCYAMCKTGFKGVSENCWSQCPDGFSSNGTYCQKPKSIGRGWGSHMQKEGYEKWGLLWYPECPLGYHSTGCCLCTPDCPEGMVDEGEQCQKANYSRQNPHPMVCPDGKEQEGFLCYDPCGPGQNGTHNVCWGQCPIGTEQCGVLCLKHGETCTAYIASIGKDTLTSALAQSKQQGHQNSIANDTDLHQIQEDAYNNQLQLGQQQIMPQQQALPLKDMQPQRLTLGPGLSYDLCPTFG